MTKGTLFLGEVFKKISSKSIVGPLLSTGILALVCLIVFADNEEISFLTNQLWVILLFFAVFWVMTSIDFAYRTFERAYTKGAALFGYDSTFIRTVKLATLDDFKIFLFPGIFVILAVEMYIVLTYLGILSVSPLIYMNIYEKPTVLGYFVFLAFIVGYIYGLGLYLVISHILFVRRIAHNRDVSIQMFDFKKVNEIDLIEKKLSDFYHLARYSSLISISWFGGITFAVLIVTELLKIVSFYTTLFLTASIIVGILLFVFPEKYVHEALKKTKSNLQLEVKNLVKGRWKPENYPHYYLPEIFETYLILSYVDRLPEWSANYTLIIEEVLGSLFPLLGLLYSIHLG